MTLAAVSACDAGKSEMARSELDWVESRWTRLLGELLPTVSCPLGAVDVATSPNMAERIEIVALGFGVVRQEHCGSAISSERRQDPSHDAIASYTAFSFDQAPIAIQFLPPCIRTASFRWSSS
jgi:hypothetical protein